MVKKYQKGGPKLTSLPVTTGNYTVTVADINSNAGANVKPLTPLQAYDFQRSIEKRKLQKKNEDILAQENKKISANKTLKSGSVVSALLGQDHSGTKTKPIMIGNYNLANNPVIRGADGLVKTLYGNEPTVSALNNNENYTTRQILDAGATNVEGAYNTGNGVIDFLNPLNIANGVVQSWASAPLEAQQSNSYLPYLKAAGNTYLAAGLPGTGKLLRYAAPEMMNTVDAAKRLYGKKLSKSYNNFTTNTGEVIDNLGNRYLPNAYKLNPYAFKPNPKAYYRMLGETGVDDVMQSKIIRANQNLTGEAKYAEPYFSKGYPLDGRMYKGRNINGNYKGPGMVEVVNEPFNTSFPKSEYVATPINELQITNPNVKVYTQDWRRGYKQIEIPKQLPGSTNSFGEIPTNLSAINLVRESSKPKSKMYKSSEIIKDSNFDIKKIFRGDKENPKQIKITGKSGEWTVNRSKDGSYYFNAKMSNPLESGKAMLKINELLPPKPTILEPNSLSLDSYLNTLKLGKRPDWEAKFENYIPLNHSAKHNKTLSSKFGFNPEGTQMPFQSLEDANIALKDVNAMLKKQGINYEADVIANGNGWYGISIPNFKLTRNHKQGGMVNDNSGYLTSNLHNFTPKKIIKSNHITTQGMAFPIKANGVPLYPNTGDYIFPTNRVVELPMFQKGGRSIIYTSDPNNLGLKKYTDSLNTFNNFPAFEKNSIDYYNKIMPSFIKKDERKMYDSLDNSFNEYRRNSGIKNKINFKIIKRSGKIDNRFKTINYNNEELINLEGYYPPTKPVQPIEFKPFDPLQSLRNTAPDYNQMLADLQTRQKQLSVQQQTPKVTIPYGFGEPRSNNNDYNILHYKQGKEPTIVPKEYRGISDANPYIMGKYQQGGPILNNRSMLFNQMPNPTFLPLDRSREYYLNNNGKRVSENKIGIGDERGEWVIPTTINGMQLSEQDAIDHFYQTGEHMGGPYETIDESNKSAESRTRAYNGLSALEDYKNGGIPDRYKKQGFTRVGQEKDSTRPGKKWMVLAKKGDSYKVVHGGDSSMQDYTQHHDNQRKKNFWNRMGHTSDKFSPRYWHKRLGKWEEGGIVDTYKQGGINIIHNGQPMYKTLDGRIVKRGLWSNTYLSNKK